MKTEQGGWQSNVLQRCPSLENVKLQSEGKVARGINIVTQQAFRVQALCDAFQYDFPYATN